jgi:hypothetical protein
MQERSHFGHTFDLFELNFVELSGAKITLILIIRMVWFEPMITRDDFKPGIVDSRRSGLWLRLEVDVGLLVTQICCGLRGRQYPSWRPDDHVLELMFVVIFVWHLEKHMQGQSRFEHLYARAWPFGHLYARAIPIWHTFFCETKIRIGFEFSLLLMVSFVYNKFYWVLVLVTYMEIILLRL